jgi:hypothetical protein
MMATGLFSRRRFRHGCRTRTAAEIEALDQLSRTRALSLEESLRLEDAINRERDQRRKERQLEKRKPPLRRQAYEEKAFSQFSVDRSTKPFGDLSGSGA